MSSKHDSVDRIDFAEASISARTSGGLRRCIDGSWRRARPERRSGEPSIRKDVTDFNRWLTSLVSERGRKLRRWFKAQRNH
jgi:hypothetical protein